jgi:hypothetical protein
MARALLTGILVAILACVASANGARTNEHAAPGTVAGIAGGGPVTLQPPRSRIAAAV